VSFAERFVAEPDLFPARDAGEPFDDLAIALDYAGGPYVLRGLNAQQRQLLAARYETLPELPPPGTGTETRVFEIAPEQFLPWNAPGEPYDFDVQHLPGEFRMAGLRLMARIATEPVLGGALWTCQQPWLEFQGVVENYLRALMAYRLLSLGGVLLHSAAVVDAGVARVFFGHSGAGKSTISRLALDSGRQILSDDLNAVLPLDGGAMVQRLPFAGELGQTGARGSAAPLRGLYALRQAKAHAVQELPPAVALASLVASAPYVNNDPQRMERLFDNLCWLLDTVPVRELAFARDPAVWDILD